MSNQKLKSPDLTRFGFYLYPKVYTNTMGFKKAHGLLFLDSRGRIESDVAQEVGMIKLLNSSTAVLYAINPVDGKYPNASELLRSLSLGSVAKQRVISSSELRAEFLNQCDHSGIVIDHLDKSYRLGVNKDNNVVFESKSGRYMVDKTATSHRHVSFEQLLYGVDSKGEINNEQVKYCLESLFKYQLDIEENEIDFIDANDFNNFVQTITRPPPSVLPKMGEYEPISFYSSSKMQSIGAKTAKIIDILEELEAEMMSDFDFDDDEAFERYFHHVYNRCLPSTQHGYKPNMPAPLLILLLKLMKFNLVDNPVIYAHSVGNLSLLAGLVKLKENGISVVACERFADKQTMFNKFLKDNLVEDLVVHTDKAAQGFDGSIGYLSNGDSTTPVLIPDSDTHSYKKSVVQMLELLEARKPNGRSIFISPVDDEGSLGYLDHESIELVRHLYQNYQNVVIFDCNQALSIPSRNNCEYRIFIIGERIDDYSMLNTEGLAELSLNPTIKTVDTPNDFYMICNECASEIDAVEISTIDLMDNLIGIIESEEAVASNESTTEAANETADGVTAKTDSAARSKRLEAKDNAPEPHNVKSDKPSLSKEDEVDTDDAASADSTTATEVGEETATDGTTDGGTRTSGGGNTEKLTAKPVPELDVHHTPPSEPEETKEGKVVMDSDEAAPLVGSVNEDEDEYTPENNYSSDEDDNEDDMPSDDELNVVDAASFVEPEDLDFDSVDAVQDKANAASSKQSFNR